MQRTWMRVNLLLTAHQSNQDKQIINIHRLTVMAAN